MDDTKKEIGEAAGHLAAEVLTVRELLYHSQISAEKALERIQVIRSRANAFREKSSTGIGVGATLDQMRLP